MRRLAPFAALLFCASVANGCGSAAPASAPPTSVAQSAAPSASADPNAWNELQRMKHFHSKRFGVVIPLPDGTSWRIDDHSKDSLFATHSATSSTLTFRVFADEELMSRQKCEARARAQGLVAPGDLRSVEDGVTFAMKDFDTRVWVAIEPPPDPSKKLVGHVYAFGGFLRKCFFFHYASEIANAGSAAADDAMSARLAFAKTRILGEMTMDDFDAVPKQAAPTRAR